MMCFDVSVWRGPIIIHPGTRHDCLIIKHNLASYTVTGIECWYSSYYNISGRLLSFMMAEAITPTWRLGSRVRYGEPRFYGV